MSGPDSAAGGGKLGRLAEISLGYARDAEERDWFASEFHRTCRLMDAARRDEPDLRDVSIEDFARLLDGGAT